MELIESKTVIGYDGKVRDLAQFRYIDSENHKEWIQSKSGSIDLKDVIYVMGKNNIRHLIIPTLRKYRVTLFFIVFIVYGWTWAMMWFGWNFWSFNP